jgi:hypothetical protein
VGVFRLAVLRWVRRVDDFDLLFVFFLQAEEKQVVSSVHLAVSAFLVDDHGWDALLLLLHIEVLSRTLTVAKLPDSYVKIVTIGFIEPHATFHMILHIVLRT